MLADKLNQLTAKKERLDAARPLPEELIKNLDEWFKIEITYTSNAIEGNTLSRQETALVVEKGITVEGKTIEEHLEAKNHAEALDFVKNLIKEKERRQDIAESDILDIHRIILQKIDDKNAGRYRNIAVRIAGSNAVMPNPLKVPELMTEFMSWLRDESSDHPVKIAADAHFKLVSIHPFTDGNGRTARILMNILLQKEGYPAAIIRKEDRKEYLNSLEKGQTEGEMEDYYNIIYDAVERSLDIYLESIEKSKINLNLW